MGWSGMGTLPPRCSCCADSLSEWVHCMCRVLQEIHETFPGQLSQHSEQTHGNVTWLAIAKGRMEDVMRLLDQAAACGWTPRPALLSVGGSPSACGATLRSVLACPRMPQSADCSGVACVEVRATC